MAEEELEDGQSSIPDGMTRAPSVKEDVTMTLMRAKSAANQLDESLKRTDAGEEGAEEAGFLSKQASSRVRIDEAIAGSLADYNEASSGKALDPGLMSADMADVDEMTRSEMYKEIEMLRQREVTLAKLLKRSSSGAPEGTATVTLLKAILDSHEQDRKQKSDLTMKKERMRGKILNKVRQKGDGIKAIIDEKLQSEMMMQVALMRLQYRGLWQFCRRSGHAQPSGLPGPPEFGQFFEVSSWNDYRLASAAPALCSTSILFIPDSPRIISRNPWAHFTALSRAVCSRTPNCQRMEVRRKCKTRIRKSPN